MDILEKIMTVIVFSFMTWFALASTVYAHEAFVVEAGNPWAGNSEDDELRRLLDAICEVESGCDSSAVGDGGKAIGAYQIWESYWIDACNYSKNDDLSLDDGYESCLDKGYAEKVVLTYWKRYANERRLGRKPTLEDRARMHNGGPRAVWAKGKKKQNLDRYWKKVQEAMK